MKRLVLFAFAATCGLASCQKEDAAQPATATAKSASADARVRGSATATSPTSKKNAELNCIEKLPKPGTGVVHTYSLNTNPAVLNGLRVWKCNCSVSF